MITKQPEYSASSIQNDNNNIVTDWSVSRKRLAKQFPTSAHPTVERHSLLSNRTVNTPRSNEYATIGCPLIGNARVNTPDNNTGYPLLSK
jgi:hypothetical protein